MNIKIEIDTNELQWWWLNITHFKIPRLKRKLQSFKYILSNLYDPPPKNKKGESVRDWLKRIPSKYAERYANFTYTQARSYYLEAKKRQVMYSSIKMSNKKNKELNEILNLSRELFTTAEEYYKEVIIRRN